MSEVQEKPKFDEVVHEETYETMYKIRIFMPFDFAKYDKDPDSVNLFYRDLVLTKRHKESLSREGPVINAANPDLEEITSNGFIFTHKNIYIDDETQAARYLNTLVDEWATRNFKDGFHKVVRRLAPRLPNAPPRLEYGLTAF